MNERGRGVITLFFSPADLHLLRVSHVWGASRALAGPHSRQTRGGTQWGAAWLCCMQVSPFLCACFLL